MINRRRAIAILVATLGVSTNAQTVAFNSPTEWMTVEEPGLVAKTLIDTAKVGGEPVALSLYLVEKGRKKLLAKKSLGAVDYSQEFGLGTLPGKMIGGEDYLTIEWTTGGKNGEKGTVEPFGYVGLDEAAVPIVLKPREISGEISVDRVKKLGDALEWVPVSGAKVGAVWNASALGLVLRKPGKSGSVTVVFDGKNGKNAFLAYADRFVTSRFGEDSLKMYHFTRTVSDSGVRYRESRWLTEAKEYGDGELSVIVIPWHDLGILPTVNRRFGMAFFAENSLGMGLGAVPAEAKRDIPGSWGDCELRNGEGKRKE